MSRSGNLWWWIFGGISMGLLWKIYTKHYKEMIAQSQMGFHNYQRLNTEKRLVKWKQLLLWHGRNKKKFKTEVIYNLSRKLYQKNMKSSKAKALRRGWWTNSTKSEAPNFMNYSIMGTGKPWSKLCNEVRKPLLLCEQVVYRFKSIIFAQSGVDEADFQKTTLIW